MPPPDDADPESDPRLELVFAVAHEVGNHLAGIRLQAHLLDESLGARELAEASLAIDALAGRAAPLLALVRPLLAPEPPTKVSLRWRSIESFLRQALDDSGTRGVRVEILGPAAPERPAVGFPGLEALLRALLEATIEGLAPGRSVSLRAERRHGELALHLDDDGEAEDLSPTAPLRGRPLRVAMARCLSARAGGRVEVERRGERTRVSLLLPDV